MEGDAEAHSAAHQGLGAIDSWRARTAAQTLTWLKPLAQRMGVTRLANITGLDRIGIPVWTAIRPTSRALATSQGKGTTDAAAQVGALMESIETWHAEHYEGALVYESPYRLHGKHGLVALDRLPRLAGRAFSLQEPLLWASGHLLRSGEPMLIPWESVSLNTACSAHGRRVFVMSSNGLAGGNSRDEAVVHALYELIERHALANWRRLAAAEVKATQVDLTRVESVQLPELLRCITPHAIVGLWEMTAIPGIPAYACLLVDVRSENPGQVVGACAGYAANANAQIAAINAILEAVQARATLIAGSRDDLDVADYTKCRDPSLLARMRAEIASALTAAAPLLEGGTNMIPIERQLTAVLECLSKAGIGEPIVVDLTKPAIGVPVVKLIVPDLEQPGITARMFAKQHMA